MLIKEYIYNSLQDIYPPEEVKGLALIIGHSLLKLSGFDIYAGKYNGLSAEKKQLLENAIKRLRQYEPIQYIVGNAEFYGFSFAVAPGVLIPRPETEELVNLIICEANPNCRILDIGTGSGCIAIALAKKIAGSVVQGWDISEQALAIAQKNNQYLKANALFRKIDILTYTAQQTSFDIVVSNPPYITEQEKEIMHPNVLNWEPGTALFVPNNDPLLFYRAIATKAKEGLLLPNGKLYFEINQQYGHETIRLLQDLGYNDIKLIKDLFGNDRIITART
ncbi:peptide chain release factor N(5)-glutamine methyltransferase [Bacteroides sp. OttesenSCG-928-N06]|nr:peptide chain release factor N(5)-glutamine methyltransferase [Bacteroides sp. OttesenSCG-928-N06]